MIHVQRQTGTRFAVTYKGQRKAAGCLGYLEEWGGRVPTEADLRQAVQDGMAHDLAGAWAEPQPTAGRWEVCDD